MLKKKITSLVNQIKKLSGDPHYIAFGMAIGVFVAITPTIPFHTVLAIALAVFFRASKAAAVIGVWVSNPFTVVFLYFACYKAGHLFFGNTLNALDSIRILIEHLESDIKFTLKINYFIDFIQTNLRTFMIMNLGGIILGVPAGFISYFITKNAFIKMRRKKRENRIEK